MWKSSEKRPFFRADMAGLGKYSMGGYGRIGVHRVKIQSNIHEEKFNRAKRVQTSQGLAEEKFSKKNLKEKLFKHSR